LFKVWRLGLSPHKRRSQLSLFTGPFLHLLAEIQTLATQAAYALDYGLQHNRRLSSTYRLFQPVYRSEANDFAFAGLGTWTLSAVLRPMVVHFNLLKSAANAK
jgi:hypothetical protein